jgi:hypothetical protein
MKRTSKTHNTYGAQCHGVQKNLGQHLATDAQPSREQQTTHVDAGLRPPHKLPTPFLLSLWSQGMHGPHAPHAPYAQANGRTCSHALPSAACTPRRMSECLHGLPCAAQRRMHPTLNESGRMHSHTLPLQKGPMQAPLFFLVVASVSQSV